MSGTTTSSRTGSVDVWLADVDAVGELDVRLLDEGERAVLRRLRFDRDRRSYLVGHVLLRLALSRAAADRVPAASWQFTRSACGRPSVAPASDPCRPDFSLSRPSGLAVLAVAATRGCRVGVDAEPCDRPLCCIPADVALSPAERSRLASFPPHRQPSEFIRLWTLKEAYGKLRGRGICLPMERVELSVSPPRLVRTEEGGGSPADLHLETRRVRTATGPYFVSLAVQCPPGVRPRASFHLLDAAWSALQHNSDQEAS